MHLRAFGTAIAEAPALVASLLTLGLALLLGLLGYLLLFKVLFRLAVHSDSSLQKNLLQRWRPPAKLLLPLVAVLLAQPSFQFPPGISELLRHLGSMALIAGIAWLMASTILGLRDLVLQRYDVSDSDNLKARTISTQVTMLVRITIVIVIVLAGATMLMTFETVRQVGVSLLASAGIAGIIIGFAAQRSLAALLAGIQIAITQPIRLDDVVIVEGEWGRVEEITLTYVVVRIWDLRRLVLPITYFLEKPFQNWTRASADLLGTVFLHCDYRVPVAEVRAELERILARTELWDGKVCGLVVFDATDRTVVLRAMVSAPNSGAAWDLRCHVREKLIEFLQRDHPECLPRLRTELEPFPAAVPSTEGPAAP
ncbi:mechanosensitive ion channel family protein [Trichlorobacter ammonificans]|uniref:Small-conductance mechanosensitive channel n=1 Tax=Trichlorobacter ammonificans TaxID=2916410 RepID=A0ABN8HDL4_9BACT|nr:mechanosensitive ion channel domain-containing protein [Trichlorobacter ammonificans]CAH2030912.1 Small-conductance mechanosensitive channel [Trichlorobacter ammonificans]